VYPKIPFEANKVRSFRRVSWTAKGLAQHEIEYCMTSKRGCARSGIKGIGMTLGNLIGDILSQAVGVAISPIPIIAVILMLFSERARSNGLAFAAGWVGALTVVGSLVLLAANAGRLSGGGAPTTVAYILKTLFGLAFLWLAVRQWRGRPSDGEPPAMPKWMSAIDSFGAGKAFGIAALLAGVNPKNLGLTLAAALTIAQAGLGGSQQWVALAVFVVVGSVSVLAPVVYFVVAGESAARTLTAWKSWLTANNATVMAVLFLILGSKLLGDGIGGLLG
jgi:hypothetical protein